MKYLLALVIALGINYSLPNLASAQTSPPSETVCYTKTLTQFMLDNQDLIKEVYVIEGAELEEFMKNVNIYRSSSGGSSWGADVMLIGLLSDDSIGIVLFQDGCMVKDSAYNSSKEDMAKVFESNKSLDILKRLNLIAGESI